MYCMINFKNCPDIIAKTSDIDVIKMIYFMALTQKSCTLSDYIAIIKAIVERGYMDNILEWDIMYMKINYISNNKI